MAQYVPLPTNPTSSRRVLEVEAAAWLSENYGPLLEPLTPPAPRKMGAAEYLVRCRLGQEPGADLLPVAWSAAGHALEMAERVGIEIDPRGAGGEVGRQVAIADALLEAFDRAHGLKKQGKV